MTLLRDEMRVLKYTNTMLQYQFEQGETIDKDTIRIISDLKHNPDTIDKALRLYTKVGTRRCRSCLNIDAEMAAAVRDGEHNLDKE